MRPFPLIIPTANTPNPPRATPPHALLPDTNTTVPITLLVSHTRPPLQLSAKLLQGWTLLAENCPHVGCHVPLLRNKKMETYCVDCKKFNPTEDDEESKTPAAAAATTTTAAAAASGSSYYDDADFHATRESLYSNGDAANTASSSSSAAAAASASSASASAASPASSASAHARLSASIARSPPKPKGASSSSKIAEKLLAGWTLMNDTCPTSDCFVPLCKNRQGQM